MKVVIDSGSKVFTIELADEATWGRDDLLGHGFSRVVSDISGDPKTFIFNNAAIVAILPDGSKVLVRDDA